MGLEQARNQYAGQLNQARVAHWDLTAEFDYLLSQLLADHSMVATDFMREYGEKGGETPPPRETPLSRIEGLWRRVFPGRSLRWRDWRPLVVSETSGTSQEYSGNQMSDGEKAALFLMGRVFNAEPRSILVVDEPETHLHSMLAVRLWNQLEDSRPDVRFVYVTHDLTFAQSRRGARYVLASPTDGLRTIEVDASLPADVAEDLLGSASLSFYASRIVFCEGDEGGLDSQLYHAWFNGVDTVVHPVDNSQRVLRCVDALSNTSVTQSLEAIGIIDRDYRSDRFLESLPRGVHALRVHEVESLFAIPGVVEAVASHIEHSFDPATYHSELVRSVTSEERVRVILERWKARVEPLVVGVIAESRARHQSVDDLIAALPAIFDTHNWSFSPQTVLQQERDRVDAALGAGDSDEFLAVMPGKPLLSVAARYLGMNVPTYRDLIISSIRASGGSSPGRLRDRIVSVIQDYLPARAVAVSAASVPPPLVS